MIKAYIDTVILSKEPELVSEVNIQTLQKIWIDGVEMNARSVLTKSVIQDSNFPNVTLKEMFPNAKKFEMKYKYTPEIVTFESSSRGGDEVFLKDILYYK